jgi:hypothetical protein
MAATTDGQRRVDGIPATPVRATALATALLALLLLGATLSSTVTAFAVVEGVGAAAAAVAAGFLLVGNAFEARLAAVLVGGLSAAASLLAMTIGLPGETGGEVAPRLLLTLVVGLAVPLLVARDARSTTADRSAPPYAP